MRLDIFLVGNLLIGLSGKSSKNECVEFILDAVDENITSLDITHIETINTVGRKEINHRMWAWDTKGRCWILVSNSIWKRDPVHDYVGNNWLKLAVFKDNNGKSYGVFLGIFDNLGKKVSESVTLTKYEDKGTYGIVGWNKDGQAWYFNSLSEYIWERAPKYDWLE
ncbi:MAG TPA: hypothetical protein ENF81_08340 [Thermotogaceae bacterium]|nr:hypothetical protein [Thermotogaceae bacterium]